MSGLQCKLAHSPEHGRQGCAADAHGVYILGADHSNADGQRVFVDHLGGVFPPGLGQFF
jgi:hypothetical protein